MSDRRVPVRSRLKIAGLLALALSSVMAAHAQTAAQAQTASNTQTRLAFDFFDPLAPTVTVEDILEHRSRAGAVAEAQRDASLRASRSCMAQAPAAPAAPAAVADAASAVPAVREDLKNKSVMELAQLYKERPDPDVAAALQWKATQGAAPARPGAVSPGSPAAGARPSLDQRLLQLMERQGRSAQPAVQECLAAAERQSENRQGEPNTEFYLPGFDTAIAAIRDGRARSVALDLYAYQFLLPEKDGKPVDFKSPPTGRLARYNVVAQAGPHGHAAVPLDKAYVASRKPDREHWPEPPASQPTPPAPPEQAKPKPTLLQKLRDLAGTVKP